MSASNDYDVIIVGGGGAGIAAAIEALNAGASVLLCEAAQRIGGSAATSGGVIMAAGTAMQKAKGIEDSAEALFHHYMTSSFYEVEPALAKRLCDGGVPAIEWLQSFGITFNPDYLYVTGVEEQATPRGHPANGSGFAIMQALEQAASAKGLQVALNTRVRHLLVDDEGAVCGIRVDDTDIHAPAVVIATGGFGNNRELLEKYYHDAAQHGEKWNFYVGIDENRGDGLLLGEAAGAAIVGIGCGNSLRSPSFSREPEPYIPGWLVYVNKEGFRFIDETAAYVVMDHVLNKQTDSVCYAIMDHTAFARSEDDPRYKSKEFLIFPAPNWMPGKLAEHLANGKILQADSLQALGEKAGVMPEALAATIAEYNQDVAIGQDTHFFKAPVHLQPVMQPPFYAVEIRAAAVGTTMAGLRVDVEARVIGKHGSPIKGLYCAGECAGGIIKHYVGGGNSLLNCFVYGRIAGQNAAARV